MNPREPEESDASSPKGYAAAVLGAEAQMRERVSTYVGGLKQTELFEVHGVHGKPMQLRYEPGLEGLRTILLLAVVLGHSAEFVYAPSWFRFTAFGSLTMFFFLSGFLVTAIIVRNYERGNGLHYRSFMWRRITRLGAPLYLFAVVELAIAWLSGDPMTTPDGSKILGAIPNFLALITYTINLVPSFGYLQSFSSIHLWSLGVDMQVYLVLPLFLALLFLRTKNLWTITKVLGGLFIVLQFVKFAEFYHYFDAQAVQRSSTAIITYAGVYQRPLKSLDAFIAGTLFALLWKYRFIPFRLLRKLWIPATIIFSLQMIFIIIMAPYPYMGGYFVAIACSVVMVAECLRSGSPLNRFMSSFIMRALGRVSYTVYIWHLLVMIRMKQWVGEDTNGVLLLLITWVVLGLVSVAAWWVAERPLMRLPPLRQPVSEGT